MNDVHLFFLSDVLLTDYVYLFSYLIVYPRIVCTFFPI